VPATWRYLLIVIFVATLAGMAIATYRLATTPDEILGAGFRGLPPGTEFPKQ
jgi:hypothetical protein